MDFFSQPTNQPPVPDQPTTPTTPAGGNVWADASPHLSHSEDTQLRALSETAVLHRIFPRLPNSLTQIVGRGDDAAVMAAPDRKYVATTDMMVHGPDFRLAWSTPHDLGWKAAASNLADIAAMGASPTALLVAIAAPSVLHVSVLEGIADGLRECCAALAPQCGVVGGDLSTSDSLTISVTALGDLENREPVLRSGAQVGDVVALAGALGAAGRGLRLLFDEGVDAEGVPNVHKAAVLRTKHPEIINAQLAPRPPIFAGKLAALAGATAMIDISDGLTGDALHLATASGVGIDFRADAFKSKFEFESESESESGAEFDMDFLSGGEDHALLATFPPHISLPDPFHPIGQVVVAEGAVGKKPEGHVSLDGRKQTIRRWDPYREWDRQRG